MRLSNRLLTGSLAVLAGLAALDVRSAPPSPTPPAVTVRPTVAATVPAVPRELAPPLYTPTPRSAPLGSLPGTRVSTERDIAPRQFTPGGKGLWLGFTSIYPEGTSVIFEGRVENLGETAALPRVVVTGRRTDGSFVSVTARLTPAGAIRPQGYAEASARLGRAILSTVRATLEDGSDSRGELGSTAGQRLADCLAFSASIPDGPGRWSLVVDVEVRNGCGEPVPAARAAFRVVVRGASGEILEQAVGSPDGPVAARASKRVSVDMKAPRSGVVTATSAGRPR